MQSNLNAAPFLTATLSPTYRLVSDLNLADPCKIPSLLFWLQLRFLPFIDLDLASSDLSGTKLKSSFSNLVQSLAKSALSLKKFRARTTSAIFSANTIRVCHPIYSTVAVFTTYFVIQSRDRLQFQLLLLLEATL